MNYNAKNIELTYYLDTKEEICFNHHQGLVVGRVGQNIL
jgi:hypothetical protein